MGENDPENRKYFSFTFWKCIHECTSIEIKQLLMFDVTDYCLGYRYYSKTYAGRNQTDCCTKQINKMRLVHNVFDSTYASALFQFC